MQTQLLKAEIVKNNDTYVKLGDCLGLSEKTVQNKVLGRNQFLVSEVRAIKDRYSLTPEQVSAIFFN